MKKYFTIIGISVLCAFQAIKAQSVSNYQFSSSTGSYSSISGSGTGSSVSGINNSHQAGVSIGFSFVFGPVAYSHVAISSNGLIRLGQSNTINFVAATTSNGLSNTSSHRPFIAPLFDDLSMVGGNVYYQTTGSAPNRVFTVEWKNAHWSGSGSPIAPVSNFQLKLYETSNNIEFVYGSMASDTTSATASIGINDSTSYVSITPGATPTRSSTVSTNNIKYASLLPSGTTYTFSPPAADIQNLGIVSPVSPFWGNAQTVTVRLKNNGSNTINFASTPLTVSGVITGPNTATASVVINSGTLAATATQDVTLTNSFKIILNGNYTFKTWGNIAADLNKTNDTATNTIAVQVPVSYTASRSTGVSLTSIASSGNTVAFATANGDDQLSPAITMPFNFVYNGQQSNQVRISTNGFLTLDAANTNSSFPANTIGSNASNRRAIIAPFWDDLTCTGHQPGNNYTAASQLNGSIRYSNSGSAPNRVFTVQWTGMEVYGNTGPDLTFQVKLYETTNNIEFRYGSMIGFDGSLSTEYSYSLGMTGFSSSASLGANDFMCIQNENGSQFAATAFDNHRWVPECNTMFSFVPGNIAAGAPPTTVTNNECTTQVVLTLQEDTPTVMGCSFYRTGGATASPSVPACNAGSPGTSDDDVWFRFAVNSYARPVKIDLRCGPGFDGVMQLFSGNCGSMTSLACANATGNGQREFIIQQLATGNYWVRVYHAGTGSGVSSNSKGNFAIYVYDAPIPPANDNISGAVQISAAANCTQSRPYRTMYAQASSQAVCAGTADKDVWFYFRDEYPMQILRVTPSSPGNTFNAQIAVYNLGSTFDTTRANAANLVSCWNKTGVNQTEYDTIDDMVYQNYYAVRIYNATGGSGGTGKFLLCMTYGPGQWTGAVDRDWRTPGNWTKSEVPGSATRTRIPAGRPRYPLLDQQQWTKDLLVDSLASFTMAPGGLINIYNQFKCKGTWNDTCGWVNLFKGHAIPAVKYNKLQLYDASTAYSLTGNASVNWAYVFDKGTVINSNGYTFTVDHGFDLNGSFLGDGRVILSNNVLVSLRGKGTMSNVEVNMGNGIAASVDDTMFVTDTLRLSSGQLSVHDSGMLTIGQKTTSKGIVAFNGGKFGGGQSAHQSEILLLGDASAPQLTNFNIWGQTDLTIDRPNGIRLGDSCLVGGVLTLTNGDIDMNGNYLCAGSFTSIHSTVKTPGGAIYNNTSTGRLLILGTQDVQPITNLKLGNQNQLEINYNNDISLNSDFTVHEGIYLQKGSVDLNGSVVTLDTGAVLSEAAGGYSFYGNAGYLTTTRNLSTALSNANVAGLGLVLSTGSSLGSTTIERHHNAITKGTGKSILRNFEITTSNGQFDNVQINYDQAELNGSNYSRLRLNRSTDGGATFSTPTNGFRSTASNSTMYVGAYGVSIANGTTLFTASDSGSTPLSPVIVSTLPVLSHQTGGTTSLQNEVENMPVSAGIEETLAVDAYPNPFTNQLNVIVNSPAEGYATVSLMDMAGKTVSSNTVYLLQGNNRLEMANTRELTAGIYLINLNTQQQSRTLRVIKH